ncbi:MAG: CBS domain-containing protein [Cyanobacteria bacterium P01_A01_bin.37]
MPFKNALPWVPDLIDAIERHPLTVSPDMPIVEAIALISQAHQRTCVLPDASLSNQHEQDLPIQPVVRASCVLVVQEKRVLGIVTERDVVRLAAEATNLDSITVKDVMVSPVITLSEQSVQDIFAALFLFRRYRIRHLPIVDHRQHLVGIISNESIRQVLRPANLLRFRRVSDVMTTQVIQAPLTTRILTLAQLMSTHRVSCVVITQLDAEGIDQPVGIVTERDIVQFQALQIDLEKAEASQAMSTPLFLLSPEDSLWAAHQEMQKRRVGRLVVSWNWGKGLGIVTQTSLFRVFDPMEMYGVIENLQQTIQQLENEQPVELPPADDSRRSLQSLQAIPLAIAPEPRPASQSTVRDASKQEVLIEEAHTRVTQMMANPDSSVSHLKSQLTDVLGILDQLSQAIKAQM